MKNKDYNLYRDNPYSLPLDQSEAEKVLNSRNKRWFNKSKTKRFISSVFSALLLTGVFYIQISSLSSPIEDSKKKTEEGIENIINDLYGPFDKNRDGLSQRGEVKNYLNFVSKKVGNVLSEGELEAAVNKFMQAADANQDGVLNKNEVRNMLIKPKSLSNN